MAAATEGGYFVRGVFYPDPKPLFRYIGDSAQVTPCLGRGNPSWPTVCWDGSCPGHIDLRCPFCGYTVCSDFTHLFLPYLEYEALQAERGRC